MQSKPQQQGLESEERPQREVLSTPYSRISPLLLQCHELDSTAIPLTLQLSFQLMSLLREF